MQNYTFYIKPDTDDEERMDNIVDLLEVLHRNYGVVYEAVLRVETDKEFLVSMLSDLEVHSQVKLEISAAKELINITKGAVIEAGLKKVCPQCGKELKGRSKFCSTACYNRDWRARNKQIKKGYKTSVEVQDAALHNRTTEEARIDAVVAKASLTAPGATFEHHVTGPIMGRRL